MNSATELSRPGFSPTVPMPRIRAVKLTSLVAPETISEGASWLSARISLTPEFSSASAESAVTAIGTSESASARLVAVTMIVPASSTASSSACGVAASCAITGCARTSAEIIVDAKNAPAFFMPVSYVIRSVSWIVRC